MRSIPFLFALCVVTLSAQSSSELIPINPDTVIATVNGKPFTAAELENLAMDLPKQLRDMAGSNPQEFLRQYALSVRMQEEADRRKISELTPYKQKLEAAKRQILVQAVLEEVRKSIPVSEETLRKMYQDRLPDFRQVEARVIFVSRAGYQATLDGKPTKTITPEEAKAKAEKAVAELKKGRDFLAVAKEFTDDPESLKRDARLPAPVRARGNVPAEIRNPLLAAKEGEIIGPLEHMTGWYILKPESFSTAEFDTVRAELEREVREAGLQKFIGELEAKSTAELQNKPFWDTFLEANKANAAASSGEKK